MLLVITALGEDRPPQPSSAQAFPASLYPSQWSPAAQPLPPSVPVRLRAPAVGLDAPLTSVGLDAAGALRPPADGRRLAGWYSGGPAPGTAGTAVTTGHVTTRTGPGVFHKVGALARGDIIEVTRTDRLTAVFTVEAVEVYPKNDFPTARVYGSSGRPELRVITCGGKYTDATGWQANVVVFAALTSTK
ncbi:class F sortase [Streptomyces cadmiisoli]|uniref:Class F sortase n=1 Tax=Streptomyces cadmiisoli TaxID=2184053 RepID=A0A2Z4JCV7_9ACTN|nr:class F sortase [Streptomyces cadmiisoli]AWW42886.1 class F sortase [Streptomyces cadmiisoli]